MLVYSVCFTMASKYLFQAIYCELANNVLLFTFFTFDEDVMATKPWGSILIINYSAFTTRTLIIVCITTLTVII